MARENPSTIDLEILPKVMYSTASTVPNKNFIGDLRINFEKFVLESDSVFVVGHNDADLDSIGSATAFAYGAEFLRKEKVEKDKSYDKDPKSVYVVVDDLQSKLDASVKKLMHDKCTSIRFINKYTCLKLLTGNDFLLVTDVNQSSRVAFNKSLDKFKHIIVVDHHDVNVGTMHAEKFFIDPTKSSASEIAFRVLSLLGIKCTPDIATALLAGINLDTDNYTQKRNPTLMSLVARLMNKDKADDAYITKLRQSDLYADMKIHDIILSNIRDNVPVLYEMTQIDPLSEVEGDESISIKSIVGFTLNREQSNRIILSKVANDLRNYSDLSFAIGRIDEENKISIHARSNGIINAGELMKSFGGGGNIEMANALLEEDIPLEEVKEKVRTLLPPTKPMERTVK